MAWTPDPELHQMFLDELDQRSGRLSEAAAAMAAGHGDSIDLSAMRREGHTIKGTSRVMGYEAVGAVAAMIEAIWDKIADDALEMSEDLGSALARLTVEMEQAGRSYPVVGTAALRAAAAAAGVMVPGVEVPSLPEAVDESSTGDSPDAVPDGEAEEDVEVIEEADVLPPTRFAPTAARAPAPGELQSASRRERGDHSDTLPVSTGPQHGSPTSRREPPPKPAQYDGLFESIAAWTRDGTITVNASRLYRLINQITATRAEAVALATQAGSQVADGAIQAPAIELASATDALQTQVLGLASLPLRTLTGTLPQLVRYLSKKLGKNIELQTTGDRGVVIDRRVLEAISEPVRQLVVNAIYHGLETPARRKGMRKPGTGSLTLDVSLEGSMLELVIADDGEGVDWELVHRMGVEQGLIDEQDPLDPEILTPLLFMSGFSTGAIEGGKGEGLARLGSAVEALHGRVQFETWPGDGTRVTIRVPAWQALHRVLIVTASGMRWAIPEAAVERVVSRAEAGFSSLDGTQQVEWEGKLISLMPLAAAVGIDPSGAENALVVITHRVGSAAVAVDEVVGSFDVAVTDLGPIGEGPEHVIGLALTGEREVAFVADAGRLVERTQLVPGGSRAQARVLVVDDSESGRGRLSGSLFAGGFSTSVAGSPGEALGVLDDLEVDALVLDSSLSPASMIALVEEVRRHHGRLPIVTIADDASEEERIRAKKAGVDRIFDLAEYRDGALVTALWELVAE